MLLVLQLYNAFQQPTLRDAALYSCRFFFVFYLFRDELVPCFNGDISKQVMEVWSSLPESIRSALISYELGRPFASLPTSTCTTISDTTDSPYGNETSKSSSSTVSEETLSEFYEKCPITDAQVKLRPIERAPKNVFSFTKENIAETTHIENKSSMTVTTTTKIVSSTRGWRNVFTLPILYDVNLVPQGTIFDVQNPQLFQSTGIHVEGYNRRFAVIDAEVDLIYGAQIRSYFSHWGVELTTCILQGGEPDKRPKVEISRPRFFLF